MATIRPLEVRDYPALATIRNSIDPSPMTPEQIRSQYEVDDQDPNVRMARFVAEDAEGNVVAYLLSGRAHWLPAGESTVFVAVDPAARRRGIGSRLLEHGIRYAESIEAATLHGYVRGEDEDSLAWAVRRGFSIFRRRTESVLDLHGWDGRRFADHLAKVQAAGITLTTLGEGTDPELLRGLYELERATVPDIPSFPGAFRSYETWHRELHLDFAHTVYAAALDGGRPVGCSILLLSHDGDSALTAYTGVLREYRGRGIALAVKLLTIEAALAHGVTQMRTNNDPDNPAMLAVNAKLGYYLIPGPWILKRPL